MAGAPGGARRADGRAHCCEGRMRVRQAGQCFAGVQCSEGCWASVSAHAAGPPGQGGVAGLGARSRWRREAAE
eukprot:5121649-Pyramimonas_sp.AAC.1